MLSKNIPIQLNNLINKIKQPFKKEKPNLRQLRQLFRILNSQERLFLIGFGALIIFGLSGLGANLYLTQTQKIPQIGGIYREGILGQPRFINPVLSQTNDTDRAISQIIYSSLFKYNGQSELIKDLVEEYQISEDGKTYAIQLKKDILWHDGQPLTAEDVVFTIKTIQNPEYKSPLRSNWQTVEINQLDDYALEFKLANSYAPFLHNLTVGIIPKHLWSGISPANFALAQYNLKPIGSGPYQFQEFIKDEQGNIEMIILQRNQSYYQAGKPYLEKIILKFYDNQNNLIKAYNQNNIDGLGFLSSANQNKLKNNLNKYQIKLPSYYAVFFNQNKSKAMTDKTARLALAYATDKQEIIEKVYSGKASAVNSPLLPEWFNLSQEFNLYDFAPEHAKNILEADEWTDTDGDGIRDKNINDEKVQLEIALTTTNWPELEQTAQILKEQWEKIGAKVNLDIVDPIAIQQERIKPREYQAILFGEILGADPDPFAFWHSSQGKDPGLNLARYNNSEADRLLEEARQTLNQEERYQKYEELQKIITDDAPAIFLYSANYLYPINKKVEQINLSKIPEPAYRFSQIENWYTKTDRIRK